MEDLLQKRNKDEGDDGETDDGETDGVTQGDRVTDGHVDIEAGKERDSERLCDDEEKHGTQGDRVTDGQEDIEAGKERDSERLCDDEEKQEGGDGQRNKRRGKKRATAQPKGIGSIAVAYEGNMYALYIYQ